MSSQPDSPKATGLDKKCGICKKKFGLGKKYQCAKCQIFVCTNHSTKKFNENSVKFRHCDLCDLEIMRGEIKTEILQELAKLNESISSAKESYEKVEENIKIKSQAVQKLENELTETNKKQKEIEDELEKKVKEESERAKRLNEEIDRTKKESEEMYETEKELSEKCLENESKIEEMKGEVIKMKEQKTELMAQVEHLSNRIKASLPTDKVLEILCEGCKKKIGGDGKNSWNEDRSTQNRTSLPRSEKGRNSYELE
jgi:DNA repair exonuclease SbcCD ATPase subunit